VIRGIHHVALNTANLAGMLVFYRDVIGFEVVAEAAWKDDATIDGVVGLSGSAARQIMLRGGNAYLELFEYTAPAAREGEPLRPCDRGYTHLCLDVVDIDAEYARLTRAGVHFQRKPGDFGEIRAVYGKDPDGNVIEIQEILNAEHAFAFPPRAKRSA
jgi:catechol 2,3-dioxygenase-like lactoylglutathione lyase family enzyme